MIKARKTTRTRKTVMTQNTAKARIPTARNGDPLQDTTKNMRQEEGAKAHVTKLRIKALVALLFEIYSPVTPSEVRMIPYMVCLADREFRCHSYRQHVSYLQTHQGTLHMYGLKTIPSKSCLHHAATIMADYEWLHKIIERQAGSYARGSLLGDATGGCHN